MVSKKTTKKNTQNVSFFSKTNILVGLSLINTFLIVLVLVFMSNHDIKNIEKKIERVDNFFSQNVEGYNDNSYRENYENEKENYGENNLEDRIDKTSIDIVGEPSMGTDDAKILIVEFSDYECPFCARFFSQTYPLIKSEYVDSGIAKFVYKDFPLSFHPQGEPAAIAANCIQNELGNEKYFEFHDLIFENQKALSRSKYIEWAKNLGADENSYTACLEDPQMRQEVQGDVLEGTSLGVSGTPTLFINGVKIVGAQPFSVIQGIVEEELQK